MSTTVLIQDVRSAPDPKVSCQRRRSNTCFLCRVADGNPCTGIFSRTRLFLETLIPGNRAQDSREQNIIDFKEVNVIQLIVTIQEHQRTQFSICEQLSPLKNIHEVMNNMNYIDGKWLIISENSCGRNVETKSVSAEELVLC